MHACLKVPVSGEIGLCMTLACNCRNVEGHREEAVAEALQATAGSEEGELALPKGGKRQRRPGARSQAAGAKRVIEEDVPEEVVRPAPQRHRTTAKELPPVTSTLKVPVRRSTRQTRGHRGRAAVSEVSLLS